MFDHEPGPTAASDRLRGLDELRGVATLLVIAEHWAQYQLPQLEQAWPRAGVIASAAAVDLFFVISGFLITRGLVRAQDRPGYFRDFYERRAGRILPLALLCMAVSAIAFPATRHLWPGYAFFYNNYQLMANGGAVMTGLGPMWSLAVEEQFYLLWPLLVALVPKRFLWVPVSGLVALFALLPLRSAAVSVVAGLYLTDGRTHLRALTLMLGVSVALYFEGHLPRPRWLALAVVVAYLAAAFHYGRVAGWLTLPGAVAIVLVVGLAVSGRAVLRSPPLAWLGVRCYGFYLTHSFVLIALGALPVRVPIPVHALLMAAGCYALAEASFRWLERPIVVRARAYPPRIAA